MILRLITEPRSFPRWFLLLVCLLSIPQLPTQAQIQPDNTLGSESSQIIRDVTIKGINSDRVEGGVIRGNHLFHSFSEFNIEQQRGVYFANPANIINIFSRVTGNNPSSINGTLGVLGNANLFFLNPNGIIFGSEASLDLRGSFLATTGSHFLFPQGKSFGTINPQTAPILSVNVTAPIGIEFLGNSGETILIQGSQLTVDPNQTLALIGGEINQQGGGLFAPQGNIRLLSVGNQGVVQSWENLSFQIGQGSERRNINLSEGASVSVSGERGGRIEIEAKNLTLTEQSFIQGGMTAQSQQPDVIAGDIIINSTEDIILNDSSIIENNIQPNGSGIGGTIEINTRKLTVANGSLIDTSTFAQGNAGEIKITAQERIELLGENERGFPSSIRSPVRGTGRGNSGKITLNTNVVSLQNGGFIDNSVLGEGNAEEIKITAQERIELLGESVLGFSSSIGSSVGAEGKGNGGLISLETDVLSIQNGGFIQSSTFGEGNAGEINITAQERLELLGENQRVRDRSSAIVNQVREAANGNGGLINIQTNTLSIQDGGFIDSSTFGEGNAGEINITAQERLELLGENLNGRSSLISSQVRSGGQGNAGIISLETNQLSVQGGGSINTTTSGQGNAGEINITARERIELLGENQRGRQSSISSQVRPEGQGNGGQTTLETVILSIQDGGSINSSTAGDGNAGNINITAEERVELFRQNLQGNPSSITSVVEETGQGTGGDVTVETFFLLIQDGGLINSSTAGDGNAGNITLNATDTIKLENNSRLTTSTATNFEGGNLRVNTRNFRLDQSLIRTLTTGGGKAGNITLSASETLEIIGNGFPSLSQETLTVDDLKLGIATVSNGLGDTGNITIETPDFLSRQGGLILTATLSRGEGGDIIINADNIQTLDNSLLATQTQGEKKGGVINIETGVLAVENGGEINTSSSGDGNAGEINLSASERVTLSGESRITSEVFSEGKGDGGTIEIETSLISMRDRATVSVSNQGTGEAGNISITGNSLTLNQSNLTATSFSSDGGNINLTLEDTLFLENNSTITATAGEAQGAGNGGNITLNTSFLIAQDNSDIIANAFTGDGGNITISAQGIFGITPRQEITPLSDIVASSQFGQQGIINIETPENNPTEGLTTSPSEEVEVKFAQGCNVSSETPLAFYNLGKMGLAPLPERFSYETATVEWLPLPSEEVQKVRPMRVNGVSISMLPLSAFCTF